MGGQFAVKKGKEPSHFDGSHGFLLFPLDFGIGAIWCYVVFSLHLLAFILMVDSGYYLFTMILYSKCTHRLLLSTTVNQPFHLFPVSITEHPF